MTAVLLTVLVAGGALAGCAPQPDVSADAAPGLQASVQLVAQHAAAKDLPAAVAELDALQARLDSDVASGDVGEERAKTIQAAIDVVRTDLAQKIADAEAAAKAIADQAALDKAAEDQAARDQAALDKAAEDEAKKNAEDKKNADKPGKGNDDDDDNE